VTPDLEDVFFARIAELSANPAEININQGA